MTIAAQDAATAGLDPRSADSLDRFAETMRAGSGVGLPHSYFLEIARFKLREEGVHHVPDRHTKPEQYQSSACFDAWAKDG
jgi:hypothetical protein